VALEVLHEAPAVDVLEDDAQLPVHPLEVEDAADVLVVEDGVTPRLLHEEPQVLGSGVLSCLMTIGRWNPASPRRMPLRTVPIPPAPSS